jgi:sugar (pentulose or hexulose) kinase
MIDQYAAAISDGHTTLGIELGSTRLKAVLIGPDHAPLATGSHSWDNQFVDRTWTYSLEAIWSGLRDCYASLAADVRDRYGVELTTIGAIGVSGMMHGYLAFDASGELLVPFRTWRNTMTERASRELTALFGYKVPQRWSIAHLYEAMINQEPHVARIASLTTLSGYVHWQLTGEQVLGVGDASGMFPVDPETKTYHQAMVAQFDQLVADRGYGWRLTDLLPTPLVAGEPAGLLSPGGARLLDPTGTLKPGISLCPPEGDGGTGMVATNSVATFRGNVSAGTSIFATVVLDHMPSGHYPELDFMNTPAGSLVAMVGCNNGASELNSWAGLFVDFAAMIGADADQGRVFELLFRRALDGEPDAGGLLAYNYLSGEHITGLNEGRPLFVRTPDSRFTLANFMRVQLYAVFGTLYLGMRSLRSAGVRPQSMFAHGGMFRTAGVAQRFLAAAIDAPVSVGHLAGEGGAWGIALLAAYAKGRIPGQHLEGFLAEEVFATAAVDSVQPDPSDVRGFEAFMRRFTAGLAIERAAIDSI